MKHGQRHSGEGGIVILTGAGISAESGVPTFRASDGLWENHHVEDVATPEGFARNPELVYNFYNDRRRALGDPEIVPNEAHKALARLERDARSPVTVVTQNIDDLHERGGSVSLLHMHGELLKALCGACGERSSWPGDMGAHDICPRCGKKGSLRPDVVWFGEMPYHMDHIGRILGDSSLFLSIGTSGHVYPAAGFVEAALEAGAGTIEVNPHPSRNHSLFHRQIPSPAGEALPALVDELLLQGY